MNYLLDTHSLIWFLEGDESLPAAIREEIEQQRNTKYISVASLWEISIKISLRKLALKTSFEEFLAALLHTDIEILQIELPHILRISQMDFFHRDPFDRIIIAQSIENELIVIGKDPNFHLYNVVIHW